MKRRPSKKSSTSPNASSSSSIIVAGMMSGTSSDGLDLAAVEFSEGDWQPLWEASAPYPARLRKRVLEMQNPGFKQSARDIFALHRDLGIWYAETAQDVITKAPKSQRPHVICNHGQTVGHFPLERDGGFTIQLGDPTRIAEKTGLTVVSNLRDGDMAAGGQGAPLLPLFHQLLGHALGAAKGGIAIHNLGGISNFTYLGPRGQVIAFDTGPANIWIDAAAAKVSKGKLSFDRDGKLAEHGEVHEPTMRKLLKHPYFDLKPPKSTGRDDFTLPGFFAKTKGLKGADLVSTATAVTVESIARAYEDFIIKKKLPLRAIYLCGGGAHNPTLIDWLAMRMPDVQVTTLDEAGFASQYVEAQGFAYFGYRALQGLPIGGSWTGAERSPPGHIVPGRNWLELLGRLATR